MASFFTFDFCDNGQQGGYAYAANTAASAAAAYAGAVGQCLCRKRRKAGESLGHCFGNSLWQDNSSGSAAA